MERQKTKWANIYKDKYDVYMGRAGKGQEGYWGNPFILKKGEDPGDTLKKFEEYFVNRMLNDNEFKEKTLSLQGKTLGCFCRNQGVCHVGIIIKYIDDEK